MKMLLKGKLFSLLSAPLITALIAGCGGGGAGSSPTYSISLRADTTTLPLNIASEGPSIGGRYTTTLYVEVKDTAGNPIPGGEDNVGCSYVGGLPSGPLYYLDGEPDHETTETINGVEITTPNAYRAVTLSTNAGLATFHFHASDVAGPATVRCTVTDPGNIVRSTEITLQVGGQTTGKVSQVVFDRVSPNYLYVQGLNGPTQVQLQARLVDEAGQPVTEPVAGANNLQVRIVPSALSLAENDATLRGVDASGQTVSGASIHVRSIGGQAQFTLVSGSNPGTIQLETISDRSDNNVSNGVAEAIYNYTVISAVTEAPSAVTAPAPLVISTTSLPSAKGNIPYATLLEASGGAAPYVWTLVATRLPSGLSLSTTGVISGTPVENADGVFNFVAQVRDSQGAVIQKNFSISYAAPVVVIPPTITPPTITTTTVSAAKVGQAYAAGFTATGGTQPYTWTITPSPLAGLTMTSAGILTGTAGAAGTYPFAVTVRDSGGLTNNSSLVLTVNP